MYKSHFFVNSHRKGNIFDPSMLSLIQEEGKILGLSSKFKSLVSLLLSEAECAESNLSSDVTEKTSQESNNSSENKSNVNDLKRKTTENTTEDVSSAKVQKFDGHPDDKSKIHLDVPFYQHVNKLKRVEVPK